MRLNRKNIYEINIWPGFVDILGTLLIVTIFTVLISTITQIYFNDQLDIKRGEISSLDKEIKELLNQISITNKNYKTIQEKKKKFEQKYLNSINTNNQLKKEKEEIENKKAKQEYMLKMKARELSQIINEKSDLLENLKSTNQEVKNLSRDNKEYSLEIFELKRDLQKLNDRLSQLSKLLIDAEEEDKKNKIKIQNLGKKLNQALASKVAELSRYQSEFFKKIRKSIGEREDIIISGDRFVFPSEIFFESGSDIIQQEGSEKLVEVAKSLIEISQQIPAKIDWILRVDGHTDKIPINNDKFKSNWHLSSSRAINIVNFFIKEGIDPHRLLAAGFGENYPIDKGENDEAYQRNRRIEIKLTTR